MGERGWDEVSKGKRETHDEGEGGWRLCPRRRRRKKGATGRRKKKKGLGEREEKKKREKRRGERLKDINENKREKKIYLRVRSMRNL